tara:strand:+ start:1141 stop:1284 length:144 start_codon:yes stop_codon:yes gene_type:complete
VPTAVNLDAAACHGLRRCDTALVLHIMKQYENRSMSMHKKMRDVVGS